MASAKVQKQLYWLTDLLLLSLGIGLLFAFLAGTRPLLAPDEGRYAEIAREMIARHDYVTPYLDGIKYFEKPVLFYWLEVAAIKMMGLSVWTLRLVNVFCGLLGCLLTYFTARKLYDRPTGLWSAGILATSMLYFAMVHMISLDLPVTVFLTATLCFFLLGCEAPFGPSRRAYIWLASVAAALAVLTKGLIGIVFPGMIVFCWLLITNNWRLLPKLYLPSSLCIFAFIAVPWHVFVNMRNPEFFNFYFITQHILRYMEKEVGHYQPIWFFIPSLFVGFFPWVLFLPQTIWSCLPRTVSAIKKSRNELFLFLWATIIFLFFSFSKSKLIPYILPMVPPLAILTARYLTQTKNSIAIKISYALMVIAACGFAYILYHFPLTSVLPNNELAAKILYAAAIILVVGVISSFILSIYNKQNALPLTLVTMSVFFIMTLAAIPSADTRSVLSLAMIINSKIKPEDKVATYNQYYQDLPFYLKRQVAVVNWRNELTFGMQHQDTHEWMLNDKGFMSLWHSPNRVFAIMKRTEYENSFKRFHPVKEVVVLGETVNNVLVSNKAES